MEEVGRWRKMLRRAVILLTMAAAATMDDRQTGKAGPRAR
jgi:hypothetical protein